MKIPISVFIVAKNEEQHIQTVLNSVKNMAEVIVVDSGSTDNTRAIAERLGAKVFFKEWLGYAAQKQYAMELCSQEWVLNLDADEAITPEIERYLVQLVTEDKVAAVRFKRNDLFIDKVPHSWVKKPNNIRLFKKSRAFFDTGRYVHESATVNGDELYLKLAFLHYGYNSISVLTNKNNQYSDLKSQQNFDEGKKASIIKLTAIFPLTFIKKYFIHAGLFNGKRGFILAIMDAYYSFLKEAKLYELQQKELKK